MDLSIHRAQLEFILNSLPGENDSSERLETEPDLLEEEDDLEHNNAPFAINS